MQRLRRGETRNYLLSKQIQPALNVKLGESFVLETEDAGTGIYRTPQDIPNAEKLYPFTQFEPRRANPLAGPVYVEGVEKGDLLVINIEKIIPAAREQPGSLPDQGLLGIQSAGLNLVSRPSISLNTCRGRAAPLGTA